jgi:hypothetical protein
MIRTDLRRMAGMVAMAVTLCASMNSARADTFDPSRPPESSLSAVQNPVTLLPGAGYAIARTEMITGTDSIVLPFIIPAGMQGGAVTVSLADLGWPGLMSSLSFAATTSTSLLAQLTAPGSVSFGIASAGTYFATVYGVADPAFGSGLYSLNLSYAPVPVPAAAWLFGSGLLMLRARRRKETVINAR